MHRLLFAASHRLLPLLLAAWAGHLSGADVRPASYRGWGGAWSLDNGIVTAVVVPEVGRVMQFGFRGEPGVLWENADLSGKPMPETPWEVPGTFGSFGGDKTWPAPQSAWNWPPPDVFDRVALDAMPDGNGGLLLVSPVSPRFGIRTERHLTLEPHRPVLRIVTRYVKVQGDPVEVSVWVITQLPEPERVILPIPARSRFPGGLARNEEWPSEFLRFGFRRVSMSRDPGKSHKIGNDADRLLWVGTNLCLRIDCPRVPDAEYPDGGCSAEVYTNGGKFPYVELETLGPLRRLELGQTLSATNTYTLYRRTRRTPEAEAKVLLR